MAKWKYLIEKQLFGNMRLTFSPSVHELNYLELVQVVIFIHRFCICRAKQLQIKNIWRKKKPPESSKKQNLNLLRTSNYLHSIYIVLGILSNLEMI